MQELNKIAIYPLILVLLACSKCVCQVKDDEEVPVIKPEFVIESAWEGGDHGGYICKFKIQVDIEVPNWEMALIFPQPIHEFEAWQAVYQSRSSDDRIVYLKNTLWNGHLWPGSVVEQRILLQYFKQPGVNYAFSSGPRPDIIFLDKVYFPDPSTDLVSEMAVKNQTEYKFIASYDPVEFKTIPKSTTPSFTTSTFTAPPGEEHNPWWFISTTIQSTLSPRPTPAWNPGMAQISTYSTTTEKPEVVAISCPNETVKRVKECKKKKKQLNKCYIPQCTAGTSRFKAMQCWKFRGVCFCVSPRTGVKLSNTIVRYKNAQKLNCITGEIQEAPTPTLSTLPAVATTTRATILYTPVDGNQPAFAPRTGYDYSKIIKNSLLFYEAQRSGKLTNSRVSWRKSAHLKDGNECQKDLVGGYYDAGGYVKFGFPAASAMTVLAWSYLEGKIAYDNSGQTKYLKEALTWGTDYFIKAHTSAYELYGQVGDPDSENKEWGRPQDSKLKRPCYSINSKSPGSDLAAETAAALAATAVVYMSTGSSKEHAYVKSLIKHAKELYTFADRYRGLYSNSIRSSSAFPSQDYGDELTWAAMWLYKATGDEQYLFQAMKKYTEFKLEEETSTEFSWDKKVVGVQVLLAQATGLEKYRKPAETFCDSLLRDAGAYYTPQGLLYMGEWGPLRYACNAAFICSTVSTLKGINKEKQFKYRKFAEEQLDYVLGKSGRSFVIGYGSNFPKRPHHRASSCSVAGKCDWDTFHVDKPNAQILIGALVGGPDDDDVWTNDRADYKTNGVGLDYNAGLQSAAAMLGKFQLEYKAWFDYKSNSKNS